MFHVVTRLFNDQADSPRTLRRKLAALEDDEEDD